MKLYDCFCSMSLEEKSQRDAKDKKKVCMAIYVCVCVLAGRLNKEE
jgi:hypothetical protein